MSHLLPIADAKLLTYRVLPAAELDRYHQRQACRTSLHAAEPQCGKWSHAIM
jgi:hypothetical protein